MTEPQTSRSAGSRYLLPSDLLHHLRTPLNHILGYSEMLLEQADEVSPHGLAADLAKVRAAGQQLLSLINDSFESGPPMAEARLPSVAGCEAPKPPLAAESAGATETQGQLASGALKGRVLVVDDIETNRDVLSRRLVLEGYTVDVACSGVQALEMLHGSTFDVVLLDIMMPEMDGYEVLRRLKADAALRPIPVIMISALHELDSVVRCIETGAEDYLSKPFEPTLLKARIGACLERKRARDNEARLYEQLEANYLRLRELEQLRDDLTHMIIHDLRTPLTSLLSGIQSIDLLGDLNDDQREMVAIATAGGDTLLGMINDLLDIGKFESGAMTLETMDLAAADIVEFSVGQIDSLLKDKQLSLVRHVAPGLPSLRGDENKLRRTIVNLLGNAIKFTPAGGTVTVAAELEQAGHAMAFSVSDTGEGIPPEAVDQIFKKFGQVASRRGGRQMSTGLGLTFCKLAVEAHGGSIGVQSLPEHGSRFTFSIPLSPAK